MGILSNPKQRQKIVNAISRYNNHLCVLCYLGGVLWFLALAYHPLNAGTYFSENALLPGLVETDFQYQNNIQTYLDDLKEELKKDKRKVPREWVYDRFRELGLDTYIQNYTVQYPLQIMRGQMVPGQNVYAILRARRAASTEAIVLSTPFRPKDSNLPATTGSIALMLDLARQFQRQTYWAKDIIFLVSDHEQIGMQAWLDGYHQIESEYIQPGELMGRSGSIQAALNLEISGENVRGYNVKLEGLNGQLPNLDLFNLVIRLIKQQNADAMLHRQRDAYDPESLTGYLHSLKTMLRMMWTQATGLPSGNHGLFHRYHIEAVTLEGLKKRKNSAGFSMMTSGRIVEGVFRSLNNLLERFHQSFFFYILPSTSRYVSIGLYMPPFGLLCAAGLIKAVALWVGRASLKDDKQEENSEEKSEKTNEEKKGEQKDDDNNGEENPAEESAEDKQTKEGEEEEEGDEEEEQYETTGMMSIMPLLLSSFMMALLSYSGPSVLANFATPFRMKVEDSMCFGFLALFTAALLFPKLISRKSQSPQKTLAFDWELLKSITLIFQALVLFSVALMNISLAFFLAVILVPVGSLIHPSQRFSVRWMQKLVLLLASPAAMAFLAAVITVLEDKYSGTLDLLMRSWDTMKQGMLLTLVDGYFFGSWMFPLFSFTLLPVWLIFWGVVHCESVNNKK